jgi:di/tricarboxylate transporter
MTGATIAFGATMASTGAAKWLADISLMPFASAGPVPLIVIISVFCTLSHLLIPSCPAAVAVLVPVLAVFSRQAGVNAMLLFLPVIFTVSNSWLLPYADPLPMMCWPEKYFSAKDFFKAGALAHIALIVIVTAAVMLIGKPLGYI